MTGQSGCGVGAGNFSLSKSGKADMYISSGHMRNEYDKCEHHLLPIFHSVLGLFIAVEKPLRTRVKRWKMTVTGDLKQRMRMFMLHGVL